MMRTQLRWLAGILAGTVLGACAPGQPAPVQRPPSGFLAVMDSAAPALLAEHAVPGIAVGVVEDGRVAFTRAYGVEDRASNRPLTTGTLFNFASLSKPVTAWGALHLADRGALPLDVPVNRLLRGWQLPASEFGTDGVTVRRLLSHTAGTSLPSVHFFPADTTLPTRLQVMRGEAGGRVPVVVRFAPGTRWAYSGGGYLILEMLIEEASGRPFADYMADAVFRPLGMTHTTFAPAAVAGEGIATPHDEEGKPVAPYRMVGAAPGGLYSSVDDFVHLVAAYARSGAGILADSTFEAMLTPVAEVDFRDVFDGVEVAGARYGMGHGVHRTAAGERIVYHSGGNPGYLAYFLAMPEHGRGMVLVMNGSSGVPAFIRLIQLWSEHYGVDLQPIF